MRTLLKYLGLGLLFVGLVGSGFNMGHLLWGQYLPLNSPKQCIETVGEELCARSLDVELFSASMFLVVALIGLGLLLWFGNRAPKPEAAND